MTNENRHLPRERADALVLKFTGVAIMTGAVPVPATSFAIVAENAAMVSAIAAAMGVPISVETVAASLGTVGTINLVGRAVFVEAARAMGWFAGPLGVAGVSALGATTAGVQTWVLGRLAIAICENGGDPLPGPVANRVVREAKGSFDGMRKRAVSTGHRN